MRITLDNVTHVYSGKAHTCMCGCAGKHTYSPNHRSEAPQYVQDADDPADFNQRTVKLIVGKMERLASQDPTLVEYVRDEYVSVLSENRNRIYVAYFRIPFPSFVHEYGHLDIDERKRVATAMREYDAKQAELEWAASAARNW